MATAPQGGVAAANEAMPKDAGMPVEVATTEAPKGENVLGYKTAGIGGSGRGAH